MKSHVVIAIGALCAGRAGAQSASAQAEALFRQGKQLVAAGKLAEACAAFESSQALDPAATTLLNLADCRERNAQLATAWGLFVDAQRQLRTGDPHLAQVAGDRAAKLEARLSRLSIDVRDPAPGLELRRGDARVEGASWNHSLPIDGGTYEIDARAPGRAAWHGTVTVAPEGDAQAIEVPPLALVAAPVPVPRAAVVTPAPRASHRTLALTVTAAGVVALGGSLVAGKLAFDRWSDAQALCGDGAICTSDRAGEANTLAARSRTRGWIATGLGAAGIGAAAIGIWLFVRGDEVRVAPQISRDGVGLAIGGAL